MASEKNASHLKIFFGNVQVPHHLLMAPNLLNNLQNIESFQNLYKPFPFKSSLPVPVSKTNTNKCEDPCLQYVKNKEIWKLKVTTMKGTYKRLPKRKMMTKLISKPKTTIVPMYLLKFAELLREDPDRYFDSIYNWYFSGNGNLCEIDTGKESYFLTSVKNELRYQSENNKIQDRCLYVCNSDDAIFETIIAKSSTDHMVCLRQRNKISVVSVYDAGNSLKCDSVSSIRSDEIPITSCALNDFCKDVCYVCIDGSVHLDHLNDNKTFEIYSKDSDTTTLNNWSSVEYLNDNCIVFTCGKFMRLLDKRTERKPDDAIFLPPAMNCESITCSKLSAQKEYGTFIGTTHSLYFYDWRYIKGNNFVAKWTHGFKSSPLYMSTAILDDKEMISVGSQFSNESSIFINSLTNDSVSGVFEEKNVSDCQCEIYAPWRMPSILDTLRQSQLKGMCLNPLFELKKRFDSSTTGCILKKSGDTFKHYTLNSVGDIFCQTIYKSDFDLEMDNECDVLQTWTDTIRQDTLPLVVSSKVSMCQYYKAMADTKKTYLTDSTASNKGFVKSKSSWKSTLDTLKGYSDICANELLSVWELYENMQDADTMMSPSADTKFTVNAWMKQSDLIDDNVDD